MARKRKGLLKEFATRQGDPNTGGQTRQVIVTAYRQDALRIARALDEGGPQKPSDLNKSLGIERARTILYANYYGWFDRIDRGIYGLTDLGAEGLRTYANIVQDLPGQIAAE